MCVPVSGINDEVTVACWARGPSWPLKQEEEIASISAMHQFLTWLWNDPQTLEQLTLDQIKELMKRAGREAIEALHQSFAPAAVAGEVVP